MNRLKDGKRRWTLLAWLPVMVLFLTASCATLQNQPAYHRTVMKGSIIYKTDDSVYLCIGTKDGAAVGQELDVYKITFTGQPKHPEFQRTKTGKVKINEIVNEHFATATIISGTAQKNDIVELAP